MNRFKNKEERSSKYEKLYCYLVKVDGLLGDDPM